MTKGRRVGTFTTGIILVIFGVMFLLRLIYPNINYLAIASLWPLILILVGIEIIAAYLLNKEAMIRYDFSAIILIIILSFFAMGMGCMEYIITHMSQFRTVF
jgi:heme O synthase-like polyprenyltransferase